MVSLEYLFIWVALFASLSSPFKRIDFQPGPFGEDAYTENAGIYNLTEFMVLQPTSYYGVNSYWTIYFITASNSHDYFLVGHCNAGFFSGAAPSLLVRASMLDITDGVYSSLTVLPDNATISNDTYNFYAPPLHCYSNSADLFSSITVVSEIPGATFNITSLSDGPKFFDAGSGTFMWGNQTNEWAIPNGYVTGTITYNDTVYDIISSQSLSWFDRQWGPADGHGGWQLFIFYLSNDLKVCVWHGFEVDGFTLNMATILYPDGHHEVEIVDPDIHPSVPFLGPYSGVQYYGAFEVLIPGKNAYLHITLPVLAGEITNPKLPTASYTLFEGYMTVEGCWEGEKVTGFGDSEQHQPYDQYPQGP
ncbi:hypothetical protein K432DRAFT_399003 [Lepidopterella palustris CBS 459.81]|uniref:Hydroxyneurosporene synthase n=1 Tax=Lepidopterella palustris CBS 459.81 TaxID=1314670 RepID=A0A8E2DX56_9PEZI|nr:hypothetical protein K432DRAFT_399003 [Lepidopterella palustris CBS 459.81]